MTLESWVDEAGETKLFDVPNYVYSVAPLSIYFILLINGFQASEEHANSA